MEAKEGSPVLDAVEDLIASSKQNGGEEPAQDPAEGVDVAFLEVFERFKDNVSGIADNHLATFHNFLEKMSDEIQIVEGSILDGLIAEEGRNRRVSSQTASLKLSRCFDRVQKSLRLMTSELQPLLCGTDSVESLRAHIVDMASQFGDEMLAAYATRMSEHHSTTKWVSDSLQLKLDQFRTAHYADLKVLERQNSLRIPLLETRLRAAQKRLLLTEARAVQDKEFHTKALVELEQQKIRLERDFARLEEELSEATSQLFETKQELKRTQATLTGREREVQRLKAAAAEMKHSHDSETDLLNSQAEKLQFFELAMSRVTGVRLDDLPHLFSTAGGMTRRAIAMLEDAAGKHHAKAQALPPAQQPPQQQPQQPQASSLLAGTVGRTSPHAHNQMAAGVYVPLAPPADLTNASELQAACISRVSVNTELLRRLMHTLREAASSRASEGGQGSASLTAPAPSNAVEGTSRLTAADVSLSDTDATEIRLAIRHCAELIQRLAEAERVEADRVETTHPGTPAYAATVTSATPQAPSPATHASGVSGGGAGEGAPARTDAGRRLSQKSQRSSPSADDELGGSTSPSERDTSRHHSIVSDGELHHDTLMSSSVEDADPLSYRRRTTWLNQPDSVEDGQGNLGQKSAFRPITKSRSMARAMSLGTGSPSALHPPLLANSNVSSATMASGGGTGAVSSGVGGGSGGGRRTPASQPGTRPVSPARSDETIEVHGSGILSRTRRTWRTASLEVKRECATFLKQSANVLSRFMLLHDSNFEAELAALDIAWLTGDTRGPHRPAQREAERGDADSGASGDGGESGLLLSRSLPDIRDELSADDLHNGAPFDVLALAQSLVDSSPAVTRNLKETSFESLHDVESNVSVASMDRITVSHSQAGGVRWTASASSSRSPSVIGGARKNAGSGSLTRLRRGDGTLSTEPDQHRKSMIVSVPTPGVTPDLLSDRERERERLRASGGLRGTKLATSSRAAAVPPPIIVEGDEEDLLTEEDAALLRRSGRRFVATVAKNPGSGGARCFTCGQPLSRVIDAVLEVRRQLARPHGPASPRAAAAYPVGDSPEQEHGVSGFEPQAAYGKRKKSPQRRSPRGLERSPPRDPEDLYSYYSSCAKNPYPPMGRIRPISARAHNGGVPLSSTTAALVRAVHDRPVGFDDNWVGIHVPSWRRVFDAISLRHERTAPSTCEELRGGCTDDDHRVPVRRKKFEYLTRPNTTHQRMRYLYEPPTVARLPVKGLKSEGIGPQRAHSTKTVRKQSVDAHVECNQPDMPDRPYGIVTTGCPQGSVIPGTPTVDGGTNNSIPCQPHELGASGTPVGDSVATPGIRAEGSRSRPPAPAALPSDHPTNCRPQDSNSTTDNRSVLFEEPDNPPVACDPPVGTLVVVPRATELQMSETSLPGTVASENSCTGATVVARLDDSTVSGNKEGAATGGSLTDVPSQEVRPAADDLNRSRRNSSVVKPPIPDDSNLAPQQSNDIHLSLAPPALRDETAVEPAAGDCSTVTSSATALTASLNVPVADPVEEMTVVSPAVAAESSFGVTSTQHPVDLASDAAAGSVDATQLAIDGEVPREAGVGVASPMVSAPAENDVNGHNSAGGPEQGNSCSVSVHRAGRGSVSFANMEPALTPTTPLVPGRVLPPAPPHSTPVTNSRPSLSDRRGSAGATSDVTVEPARRVRMDELGGVPVGEDVVPPMHPLAEGAIESNDRCCSISGHDSVRGGSDSGNSVISGDRPDNTVVGADKPVASRKGKETGEQPRPPRPQSARNAAMAPTSSSALQAGSGRGRGRMLRPASARPAMGVPRHEPVHLSPYSVARTSLKVSSSGTHAPEDPRLAHGHPMPKAPSSKPTRRRPLSHRQGRTNSGDPSAQSDTPPISSTTKQVGLVGGLKENKRILLAAQEPAIDAILGEEGWLFPQGFGRLSQSAGKQGVGSTPAANAPKGRFAELHISLGKRPVNPWTGRY
eukprot:Rmarinus@m.29641